MVFFLCRIHLLVSVLLFFATSLYTSCYADGDSDNLWNIVTYCLNPAVAGYDKNCHWPIANSAAACRNTTEVWDDKNPEYVVIRDIKMCDCPGNNEFVHGLAIPRAKVTGAEAKNRPDGIWQYAWDGAVKKIRYEAEIALVVNPWGKRGQNQLHVHLVRLNDAGRKLIDANKAPCVQSPADIWKEADQLAKENGLRYFGVLVAKKPAGCFMVYVDDSNLEYAYSEAKCANKFKRKE